MEGAFRGLLGSVQPRLGKFRRPLVIDAMGRARNGISGYVPQLLANLRRMMSRPTIAIGIGSRNLLVKQPIFFGQICDFANLE
jgi:hypothetical protein